LLTTLKGINLSLGYSHSQLGRFDFFEGDVVSGDSLYSAEPYIIGYKDADMDGVDKGGGSGLGKGKNVQKSPKSPKFDSFSSFLAEKGINGDNREPIFGPLLTADNGYYPDVRPGKVGYLVDDNFNFNNNNNNNNKTTLHHPDSNISLHSKLTLVCIDNIAIHFRGVMGNQEEFIKSMGLFREFLNNIIRSNLSNFLTQNLQTLFLPNFFNNYNNFNNIAILCLNHVTTSNIIPTPLDPSLIEVIDEDFNTISSNSTQIMNNNDQNDQNDQNNEHHSFQNQIALQLIHNNHQVEQLVPALGDSWGRIVHSRYLLHNSNVINIDEANLEINCEKNAISFGKNEFFTNPSDHPVEDNTMKIFDPVNDMYYISRVSCGSNGSSSSSSSSTNKNKRFKSNNSHQTHQTHQPAPDNVSIIVNTSQNNTYELSDDVSDDSDDSDDDDDNDDDDDDGHYSHRKKKQLVIKPTISRILYKDGTLSFFPHDGVLMGNRNKIVYNFVNKFNQFDQFFQSLNFFNPIIPSQFNHALIQNMINYASSSDSKNFDRDG
jgi:hypothetical protein